MWIAIQCAYLCFKQLRFICNSPLCVLTATFAMLDKQLYNTEVYKYSHYIAGFCQRVSIIQLVMQISDKGGNY